MKELLSASEVRDTYHRLGDIKTNYSLKKLWALGMMAGAFIALGAQASNVAMHQIGNVGLARLVAGCVFPIGLMLIVFIGGELFTGDCLLFIDIVEKKIRRKDFCVFLINVWLSNLVGALLMCLLISCSGQWGYSNYGLGAFTLNLAASKSHITVLRALVSGILCNILVCAAVLMAVVCQSAAGKIFSCFFIIMAFVTSGFEHCVANMYYLFAGVFASFNPAIVEAANQIYHSVPQISYLGIAVNLLFVTIGNIIGGFLMAYLIHIISGD